MTKLERFYNDDAWCEFIEQLNTHHKKSCIESILSDLLRGNQELAMVIYVTLGSESLDWMHKRSYSLFNIKPIECLGNDNLEKRLKVQLMRMNGKQPNVE